MPEMKRGQTDLYRATLQFTRAISEEDFDKMQGAAWEDNPTVLSDIKTAMARLYSEGGLVNYQLSDIVEKVIQVRMNKK